jgi:DNA-binding transcriptional ArsR family regulator
MNSRSSSEETGRQGRSTEHVDFLAALNHPLRVKMLPILRDREASPNELAKELGEELGVVNYHARKLEKLGMAEIVRERPVRGSTEHFYKATARPWWTTEQWTQVDPKLKPVVTASAMGLLMRDAEAALCAETFDSRDERHLSRSPMMLDERGWKAVATLLDDTLDALFEEQARATARMAESGEEPIPAIVGLLSFETPGAVEDAPPTSELPPSS